MENTKMSRFFNFKQPHLFKNIFVEVIQTPIKLFPFFPYKLFYLTSMPSLIITLILAPFADNLFRDQIFSSVNQAAVIKLDNIFGFFLFDPIFIQLITLLVATVLVIFIIKNQKIKSATIFALLFPWIILLFSLVIGEYVFKPSFGYLRPDGYSIKNDTFFLIQLAKILNLHDAAPSGSVVGQIVCVLTLVLLNTNEHSPLHSHKKLTFWFYVISFFSVFLVGFQRLITNAHSLFDVVFSLGCGVIIFWLVYVVPYDVHNKNKAIEKVMSINILFVATFYFYSYNPNRWLISSLSLMTILFILDKGLKAIRSSKQIRGTSE